MAGIYSWIVDNLADLSIWIIDLFTGHKKDERQALSDFGRDFCLKTYDKALYVNDVKDEPEGDLQLLKSVVTEQSIKNKSFFRDELLEGKIKGLLDKQGICVITGSEGRGKSSLSSLIAYDYHEKGWNVYITKEHWNSSNLIEALQRLCDLKRIDKTLFVLEDVHNLEDSDFASLVSTLKEVYITEDNTSHFLINLRPSGKKENLFKSDDCVVGLDNTDNLPLIYHLASLINKDPETLMINNTPVLDDKVTSNRRLLFLYFKQLQNKDSVTDDDISAEFLTEYTPLDDNDTLLLLSCLYQFGVPLSKELLSDNEKADLRRYLNKRLCKKEGQYYYLPHSTDAKCLFRAICQEELNEGENLDQKRKEVIVVQLTRYYEKIISSTDPFKFESDFRNLFQVLNSDEYRFAAEVFLSPEKAKTIIKSLYPGFIMYVLVSYSKKREQAVGINIYQDTIDSLKTNVEHLDPAVLTWSNISLTKYYHNYSISIVKDLFSDDKVAKRYFESHSDIRYLNNKIKNDIHNLSGAAKIYMAEAHLNMREKVDWANAYLDIRNRYYDNRAKELNETITLIKEQIEKIAPFQYSGILHVLQLNYPEAYSELASSTEFKLDSWNRLKNFSFTNPEFHLLSHFFYSDIPLFKDRLGHKIKHASFEQKESTREWIEDRRKNKNGVLDEGSYADFLDKTLGI